MNKIIIPAYRDSRGLPIEGGELLHSALTCIPEGLRSDTIVLCDNGEIEAQAGLYGAGAHRVSNVSEDKGKGLREEIWGICGHLWEDQVIVVLYPTFDGRKWSDVQKAWFKWRRSRGIQSLLCRREVKTHPWDCMVNVDQNGQGEQLVGLFTGIDHDLDGWREYPTVWEVSHFIAMFKVGELRCLNRRLCNSNTVFFDLEEKMEADELQLPCKGL